MKQESNEVLVNTSGYPELELLVNSVQATHGLRDYIVSAFIAAGLTTVANVATHSIPETICMCPSIKEFVPGIHAYAINLQRMGIF